MWFLLREKCPNTEFFLVLIWIEYRKIRTRKNSAFRYLLFTQYFTWCHNFVGKWLPSYWLTLFKFARIILLITCVCMCVCVFLCVYVHTAWRLHMPWLGIPGDWSTLFCWKRFFSLPSLFIASLEWSTKPF